MNQQETQQDQPDVVQDQVVCQPIFRILYPACLHIIPWNSLYVREELPTCLYFVPINAEVMIRHTEIRHGRQLYFHHANKVLLWQCNTTN